MAKVQSEGHVLTFFSDTCECSDPDLQRMGQRLLDSVPFHASNRQNLAAEMAVDVFFEAQLIEYDPPEPDDPNALT